MKFVVTVKGWYELPDEDFPGKTAGQVAAIDQEGYDVGELSVEDILSWCEEDPMVVISAVVEKKTS